MLNCSHLISPFYIYDKEKGIQPKCRVERMRKIYLKPIYSYTKIVETIPILFHFQISLFSITKLQCDPTLDSLHHVFGYIFFFLLSPEANDITFWMRNFHWMFKTYEILNMYFIFVRKRVMAKQESKELLATMPAKQSGIFIFV